MHLIAGSTSNKKGTKNLTGQEARPVFLYMTHVIIVQTCLLRLKVVRYKRNSGPHGLSLAAQGEII